MREPKLLSPDIRDYLGAENAYLESVLAPTKPLQEALFKEMKGRIKEDDSSVPSPDGPFEYYHRYRVGGQHPLICRRPRGAVDDRDEEVLIDGDKEAEGHPYFVLADADHSLDHRLLAYATDTTGSEFCTVRVRDIATGAEHMDVVTDVAGGTTWAPNSRGFYYTRLDDAHRPSRVYYHALGTDQAEDKLIYEEKDPGFFVGVSLSEQEEYLLIDAHDHQTTEIWFAPAATPDAPLRLIAPRRTEVEYDVSQFGRSFLIVTNADGAEDFELRVAPIDSPGPENWKPLIPHRKGRLLLGIDVTKRHLAWSERERALPRVQITTIHEIAPGEVRLGPARAIELAEEAYSLGMSSGYEFDTDILRFSYASPTTPSEIYDYDMATGARTFRKRQEVPSGHNPADYKTWRVFARAEDGAEIPITVLGRADALDHPRPLLLYGYGAYGISLPAGFSTVALSLVDRGFVHAIAHVRGGTENGYHWYTEGKRLQKKNTFTDYLACARRLVELGFTAPGADRRPGRQRRRPPDGRRRQHGARSLSRPHRRGALRRRPQHDLGREPALDAAGMERMGQSGRGRAGVRLYPLVFALRECARAGLSAHARHRRPLRPPRHLLGAGEMGRQAPRPQDRRQAPAAQDAHGGRPWRRLRALRQLEGRRPRLRVRADDRGRRGEAVAARASSKPAH